MPYNAPDDEWVGIAWLSVVVDGAKAHDSAINRERTIETGETVILVVM